MHGGPLKCTFAWTIVSMTPLFPFKERIKKEWWVGR